MPNIIDIEHTTFALMGPLAHTPTTAMPCHCVIFHLGDRVVLLDTGFGTREMQAPVPLLGEDALWRLAPVIDQRLTAFARLSARGIEPGDVTDIVLTHLDNDHAGGLHDFPAATVHVAAEELGSFDSTRPRGPYKPYQLARATKFRTYAATGERWLGLEARSLALPGDLDAKLVMLPGHTFGHCGVAYREDGRWSLHAGDAYFDHRLHFLPHPPGIPLEIAFQSSASYRIASLGALRRLREEHGDEVATFCTHDQAEFARWTAGRGRPDPISAEIVAGASLTPGQDQERMTAAVAVRPTPSVEAEEIVP